MFAAWKTGKRPSKIEAAAALNLIERVEALERRWKSVELEWDDMFDRFRRLHAKLSKREKSEQAESGNGARMPQETRSAGGRHRITNPAALALLGGRRPEEG